MASSNLQNLVHGNIYYPNFIKQLRLYLYWKYPLSSISFLSLVSWFTSNTIFSLFWSSRCTIKFATMLSFRIRLSRSSRSSWLTLLPWISLYPLNISWKKPSSFSPLSPALLLALQVYLRVHLHQLNLGFSFSLIIWRSSHPFAPGRPFTNWQ